MQKQKVLIIAGPTASGKSRFAVELASMLCGEVINADSMQVYRGLDIGTAKITAGQMQSVAHHMLDVAQPWEPYSVGEYVAAVHGIIDSVTAKNKLPIICGGTGLYITALLKGHSFSNTPKNEDIRNALKKEAEEKGAMALHERLAAVDPLSAHRISPNDVKRVIRALEIYCVQGIPKSALNESDLQRDAEYDYLFFVLNSDRELLYQRIEHRVDDMLSLGLIEEVKHLVLHGLKPLAVKDWQSMQAIGYKEVLQYLEGAITYDEMVAALKQNTRRYAKRQITYFKNIALNTVLINPDNTHDVEKMQVMAAEFRGS